MLLELDMSPPTMFTLNLNGTHLERAFSPRLMQDLLVNVPMRGRSAASSRVRKSQSWWENSWERRKADVWHAHRSWKFPFLGALIQDKAVEKLHEELPWIVLQFVIGCCVNPSFWHNKRIQKVSFKALYTCLCMIFPFNYKPHELSIFVDQFRPKYQHFLHANPLV